MEQRDDLSRSSVVQAISLYFQNFQNALSKSVWLFLGELSDLSRVSDVTMALLVLVASTFNRMISFGQFVTNRSAGHHFYTSNKMTRNLPFQISDPSEILYFCTKWKKWTTDQQTIPFKSFSHSQMRVHLVICIVIYILLWLLWLTKKSLKNVGLACYVYFVRER